LDQATDIGPSKKKPRLPRSLSSHKQSEESCGAVSGSLMSSCSMSSASPPPILYRSGSAGDLSLSGHAPSTGAYQSRSLEAVGGGVSLDGDPMGLGASQVRLPNSVLHDLEKLLLGTLRDSAGGSQAAGEDQHAVDNGPWMMALCEEATGWLLPAATSEPASNTRTKRYQRPKAPRRASRVAVDTPVDAPALCSWGTITTYQIGQPSGRSDGIDGPWEDLRTASMTAVPPAEGVAVSSPRCAIPYKSTWKQQDGQVRRERSSQHAQQQRYLTTQQPDMPSAAWESQRPLPDDMAIAELWDLLQDDDDDAAILGYTDDLLLVSNSLKPPNVEGDPAGAHHPSGLLSQMEVPCLPDEACCDASLEDDGIMAWLSELTD